MPLFLPLATHNYNKNDDDASSSSNHSTVGDSSHGGSNNDYEDTLTLMLKMPIMKTMMMIPTMPMIPTIAFPILHLLMSPPLLIKVSFVMAPIVKRTTAMMRTTISHPPMPLLLLAWQGVITAMLLLVLPMPSMFLIIAMLSVAVMIISCHCHLLLTVLATKCFWIKIFLIYWALLQSRM
jgi:hypothetical protein